MCEITSPIQDFLHYPQPWYLTAQRELDMDKLLTSFQQFFREHSDAWMQGFSFAEAGPQLLMQAFLQRIVNGGGRINREYGLGREKQSLVSVQKQGLAQTADYAQRCGADQAHLVIFDRRPNKPWSKRIWRKQLQHEGCAIGVWGAWGRRPRAGAPATQKMAGRAAIQCKNGRESAWAGRLLL